MLCAFFGNLMNLTELNALPNATYPDKKHEHGLFGEPLEDCNTHKIRGWKFDYFKVDGAWNSEGFADIVEDPDSYIEALLVDIPPRVMHGICVLNNVYSGNYRFDYLNVNSQGREALVIRLAHQAEVAKPSLNTLIRIVENAIATNLSTKYIYDVIIGKAQLNKADSDYFFNEELYSKQAGKSAEYIRDWLIKNK